MDSADNIIVAGNTSSADYPTPMGMDSTFAGGDGFNLDGILTKLSADGGAIIFSTYVGGLDLNQNEEPFLLGRETIRGLFVDNEDRIYVAGNTSATDFPATSSTLLERPCGADNPPPGISTFVSDQFVARFSPEGGLDFATCLGGDARDTGRAIHVDDDGLIYLAGASRSFNYPVTVGAVNVGSFDTGADSGVVTVLNEDATAIIRSARVGGTSSDYIQDIALDEQGRVIAMGYTNSTTFPTTAGAYQPLPGGVESAIGPGYQFKRDVFAFRLNAMMTGLDYATYIGGLDDERGFGLTLDGANPVILFNTDSFDLESPNGIQTQKAGDVQAPVTFNALPDTKSFATGIFGNVSGRFLVAARDGLNELFDLGADNSPISRGPLDSLSQDSRHVIVGNVNNDAFDDVVIANAFGVNQLYLGAADSTFLPAIAFGDPGSATSHVTLLGNASQSMQIIEFIDNDIDKLYLFDNDTNALLAAEPFGNNTAPVIDVVHNSDRSFSSRVFATLRGPSQIAVYEDIFSEPGMPNINLIDVPDANLTALDLFDISVEYEALVVLAADANGGVIQIFDATTSEPIVVPVDGPPATDVVGLREGGFVSQHLDGHRYYRTDLNGTATLRQTVPGAGPFSALHRNATGAPFVTFTAAGVSNIARVSHRDMYLARLSVDGDELTFGTYLGGRGYDSAGRALAMMAPGQVILAGSSSAVDFPIVNGFQPTNMGSTDQIIARIAMVDSPADQDEDGVPDAKDNCTEAANPGQRDTNADGFGNVCDPDLNNDGLVNVVDLGLLRGAFFATPNDANWNADADFNGDDLINAVDLGIMRTFFFGTPGPSGL